jgi:uncharacterized protein YbcI
MSSKSKRSLQDVVGKEVYSVWVDMLQELVPSGRTHRLAVVVAGMLAYAVEKSVLIKNLNEEEHSAQMSLIDSTDTVDIEEIKELIGDMLVKLFKDAGVEYERVSKGGEEYSIIDEACREFSCWFEYPWDSW